MKPRIMDVVQKASIKYCIPAADIRGPVRYRPYVRARTTVAYICRQDGHSLAAIARILGNRDHTTILACIQRAEKLLAEDPAFKEEVEAVRCDIVEPIKINPRLVIRKMREAKEKAPVDQYDRDCAKMVAGSSLLLEAILEARA